MSFIKENKPPKVIDLISVELISVETLRLQEKVFQIEEKKIPPVHQCQGVIYKLSNEILRSQWL